MTVPSSLFLNISEKNPNKSRVAPFFMFEDLRVVAGQVIVDEAMVLAQTEEDLLELAVRRHAQLVYRISYSVLRNHHDAEDSTQETFVRVLRARRKLARVDDPKSWLARIAWRVAIDRNKRIANVSLETAGTEALSQLRSRLMSAEESVLGQELAGLVQPLISALPAQLREALTLSTLQELSPAEIAGILDTSEAAVRSRIFRARLLLKDKLEALLRGDHGT